MAIDLKNIPHNPGVYMMKNDKGKIIYIGKAKNLKNRVSSYFNNPKSTIKTYELVKHIHDIEFFICNNELEALILENNMIKEYKPKYNILLKDNKTYPYLKITKEKYPQISMIRSKKHLEMNDEAYYFGPYPTNLKNMLKMLMVAFEINNITIDMYNKKILGTNLRYNSKSSEWKFVDEKDEKNYIKNVNNMIVFLKNKDRKIIDKLHDEMVDFSNKLEFEKALIIRNRIEMLNNLLKSQIIEQNRSVDEDIFVFKQIEEKIFVCIFSVRDGKIVDKNSYNIENSFEDIDILERLVLSYYDNKKIPKSIIIQNEYKNSIKMVQKWFETEKNTKVKMISPIINSTKKQLLDLGIKNLDFIISEYYRTENKLKNALIDLKKILNLDVFPKTIECFDISNTQGIDSVASKVVFVNGKKEKRLYRKYKIRSVEGPDDYSSMSEVIKRRLKHESLPDLILLDGGKTHVSVIRKMVKNLNYKNINIYGMYKDDKHSTFGLCDDKKDYDISENFNLFNMITRFQDEVHRFGIEYHKKLRSERNIKSKLDNIRGVGPKRKKELIKKFGSVKNIFEASFEELLLVVPESVARQIKLD